MNQRKAKIDYETKTVKLVNTILNIKYDGGDVRRGDPIMSKKKKKTMIEDDKNRSQCPNSPILVDQSFNFSINSEIN